MNVHKLAYLTLPPDQGNTPSFQTACKLTSQPCFVARGQDRKNLDLYYCGTIRKFCESRLRRKFNCIFTAHVFKTFLSPPKWPKWESIPKKNHYKRKGRASMNEILSGTPFKNMPGSPLNMHLNSKFELWLSGRIALPIFVAKFKQLKMRKIFYSTSLSVLPKNFPVWGWMGWVEWQVYVMYSPRPRCLKKHISELFNKKWLKQLKLTSKQYHS